MSPRLGLHLSLVESSPLANRLGHPLQIDDMGGPESSCPGVDLLNSPLEYIKAKLRSASRSESNEEAVVDRHMPLSRTNAVQPQPQPVFLQSLLHHVVHKMSGSILIGIDVSEEAEGGEEYFLMLESAFAPPAVVDFTGDINEDEYWEVIERAEGL